MTHICVSELTTIVSDNGLSPGRRQAIIWNKNAGLLLIEPLGTNFSEISFGIQTFSFKKMHLNMSSAKWRPFCLCLNVLTNMIVSYGHVHIGSAFHTSLSLPQHTSLLIELSPSVSLAWRHPAEEYKLLRCRNWLHWTVKGHHGDCLIVARGIAADNKYRADSRFAPANERRHYFVTTFLIGWAKA